MTVLAWKGEPYHIPAAWLVWTIDGQVFKRQGPTIFRQVALGWCPCTDVYEAAA